MKETAPEKTLFSLETDNKTTKELDDIIIKNGVAAAIIERRLSLNLTQKDLSDFLGVSQTTVCRIENASYPLSTKFLCELCDALDMKIRFSISVVD